MIMRRRRRRTRRKKKQGKDEEKEEGNVCEGRVGLQVKCFSPVDARGRVG